MRVLYVVSSAELGGATVSLENLLAGLIRKGVDPMVVLPHKGYFCNRLEKMGIPYAVVTYRFATRPVIRCAGDVWRYPLRWLKLLANTWAVLRIGTIIREFAPQIVHSNVSVIDVGFRAAKRAGIPHIWHIREYADRDFGLHPWPSMKALRRKIVRESDAIAISRDLARYFGLSDRGRVIYNGIQSRDAWCYRPNKRPYFLFVGTLQECKGVSDLLRAFVEFAKEESDYRLLFVGRYAPAYRAALETEACCAGIGERVEFLGQRTDVLRFMQEAKALVVPSRSEGFGRITAEAMFNGCLVIGRNVAGTKEQFDNGLERTGQEIGIRYETTGELVEALRRVALTPVEAFEPLIRRAQQVVRELYSTETNLERTYDYYVQVASEAVIENDEGRQLICNTLKKIFGGGIFRFLL